MWTGIDSRPVAEKNSRTDAVRKAVDQAFQSTAGSATTQARDRAQDLVDDLAQAAGRVRGALDDLRPPTAEEVRGLREELRALEARVAKLESAKRDVSGDDVRRTDNRS